MSERIHAVTFCEPQHIVHAAQVLREGGYTLVDAHTPFAVHGLDEAMGMAESRLSFATLIGGLIGGALGMGFMIWTHAFDWPLNIGGKGFVAWQALAPVGFETIVLLAGFGTVGGLLWRSGLRPDWSGESPTQPGPEVTDDRFVLLVSERDGGFAFGSFEKVCMKTLHAERVVEGWRVR